MKQKIKTTTKLVMLGLFIFACASCKKYLDEKPDKKLVVPATLVDLQALLDYNPDMLPDLGSAEVSADNYYLTQADYNAMLQEGQRSMYTWEKDKIFDTNGNDWALAYRKIFYVNTVLETLDKIPVTPANQSDWQNIKGQALFIRARAFLALTDIFCLGYNPATASNDLGIPLKLKPDQTETSVRASLQQTFDRILADFKEAAALLPPRGIHVIRASRAGAFAYMSRAFLAMHNYTEAGKYADSSLKIYSTIIDYNPVSTTSTYAFAQFNDEQLFYNTTGPRHLVSSRAKIDTLLYRSYAANDCRKTVFFKDNGNNLITFRGSYAGTTGVQFAGIATDEVLLTRAECFARSGDKTNALADLNALLVKRYKTVSFIPVSVSTAAEALVRILEERRKELLMRCVRWMDIKRLNSENAGITLKRNINNKMYTLPPNDLRFALPLPEYIIDISGMPQNPR